MPVPALPTLMALRTRVAVHAHAPELGDVAITTYAMTIYAMPIEAIAITIKAIPI